MERFRYRDSTNDVALAPDAEITRQLKVTAHEFREHFFCRIAEWQFSRDIRFRKQLISAIAYESPLTSLVHYEAGIATGGNILP